VSLSREICDLISSKFIKERKRLQVLPEKSSENRRKKKNETRGWGTKKARYPFGVTIEKGPMLKGRDFPLEKVANLEEGRSAARARGVLARQYEGGGPGRRVGQEKTVKAVFFHL